VFGMMLQLEVQHSFEIQPRPVAQMIVAELAIDLPDSAEVLTMALHTDLASATKIADGMTKEGAAPAPGQEGALQHMGRSLLLMLLRFTLLAITLVVAGAPAVALVLGADELGLESSLAQLIAFSYAWLVLLFVDIGLVLAGGWILRRFDVARDRG